MRPFEGAIRGRPALDLFVMRFFASSDEARAALARHDIEGLAEIATPGATFPAITGVTRSIIPLAEYSTLEWNTRQAPLDNRRLREALVRGLDRTALIQRTLGGHALPLDMPILPQTPYSSNARLPSTDTAMAGRILDDLGWVRSGTFARASGDGPLNLPLMIVDTPFQRVLAAEIARQWNELGIDVPIEAVPADVFRDRMQRRSFSLALRTWTTASRSRPVRPLAFITSR